MRSPDQRKFEALAEFGVTSVPDTGCECGMAAQASLEVHLDEWVVTCPGCGRAARHHDLPAALELWRVAE